MKKRDIVAASVLILVCVTMISKALSASIDIDTTPLVEQQYYKTQPEPDTFYERESARKPTDEQPSAPAVMTSKMIHDIGVMEARHFNKKMPDKPNEERLSRLEVKLTGRNWESLPLKDRMRRIRLASQRVALGGTSIPVNLRGNFTPNRINNDSIPLAERDNDVGIIDGLLRLYKPDIYNAWRSRKEVIRGYDD